MTSAKSKSFRELDDVVLAELVRGLAIRSRTDQSTLHAARREQRRRRKQTQKEKDRG